MKNVWIIVLLISLVGCQSNKSNMAYGLAESSKLNHQLTIHLLTIREMKVLKVKSSERQFLPGM